jgi:hypothetical protein
MLRAMAKFLKTTVRSRGKKTERVLPRGKWLCGMQQLPNRVLRRRRDEKRQFVVRSTTSEPRCDTSDIPAIPLRAVIEREIGGVVSIREFAAVQHEVGKRECQQRAAQDHHSALCHLSQTGPHALIPQAVHIQVDSVEERA